MQVLPQENWKCRTRSIQILQGREGNTQPHHKKNDLANGINTKVLIGRSVWRTNSLFYQYDFYREKTKDGS